jgi:outer membrane protein
MKSIKLVSVSVLISLFCSALVLGAWILFFQPRIGYIKSGLILKDYKGMAEANEKFTRELQQAQVNADTLKNRYDNLMAQEKSVSGSSRREWAYQAETAKRELDKYQEQFYTQMEHRKQELTQKVLAEINDYIQAYAKKNNYKYILGTTNDGSILYGDEAGDLTDEILKELNEKYGKGTK